MHVPSLGSYPLTLRNYDVSSPRDGELLLNYETDDLYYINRADHTRVRVADEIYKRILAAKVQNNKLITYDEDEEKEERSPVVDGKIDLGDDASVTGHTCKMKDDTKSDTSVKDTTLIIDAGIFIYPPIADREYNAYYYIITKRSLAEAKNRSDTIHLEGTSSYVINDSGQVDVNGHIVVISPSDIATYTYKKLILDIEDYNDL